MRKILAATALAAAALGVQAPAASAGSCYGVQGYLKVCYYGSVTPTVEEKPFCVYTGGSTCETYYVPVPGVEVEDVRVCVDYACTSS